MVTDKIIIENFKSIKKLDLKPKRVNLFIGEPNSGKSNILDAISLFSINALVNFKNRFRFQKAPDLFYDLEINNPIKISTSQVEAEISLSKNAHGVLNNYFDVTFLAKTEATSKARNGKASISKSGLGKAVYHLSYSGDITGPTTNSILHSSDFRVYEYKSIEKFNPGFLPFLESPYGTNIPSLILSNAKLRDIVKILFADKGYKLLIDPESNELKMVKEIKDSDTFIMYPYVVVSETLKRIIFLMLAIESNENTAIIIDEPESNTFPFYTKYIAERIALDKRNQYFLTTHNPYLLANIIQKTPISELNLCVVKMENYETKVYPLNPKQMEKVVAMDVDVFFNLDKFVK